MLHLPDVVTRAPFPHLVVDGWWDHRLLAGVAAEFPAPDAPGWRRYRNGNERKLEGPEPMWGARTQALFAAIADRSADLEAAFGVPGLSMETVGGGYHCIEPGGYLAVHTDFTRSADTGRFRRLNLLIYLNEEWADPGGHLELWDAGACVVDITPEFNRTVVFETSDRSWHGHPRPASRWRRSVAAYFFSDEPPPGFREHHSTVWLGA